MFVKRVRRRISRRDQSCRPRLNLLVATQKREKHPQVAKFFYGKAPRASKEITVQIPGHTVGDSGMVDFIFSSEQLHGR